MREYFVKMMVDEGNYGHDDFSIGLLLDTTPHVEEQLLITGHSV